MAQIDERQLQVTIGVVGVGEAPLDLLVHQGRKMGLEREDLEAVPVVRFGLRPVILERSLVVVLSAAPLDVLQADAVIAINTPGIEDELDIFDLVPVADVSTERLMSGAGRAHSPIMLLLNTQDAAPTTLDFASVDLESGEGLSPAINGVLQQVVERLVTGTPSPRECPTLVLHATHRATGPSDLQPDTFPKPSSRLALNISLHEPFEGGWSCAMTGTVDGATGLHEVTGSVTPDGPVPEELAGPWRVELFREREIWILRSMYRPT